MRETATGGKPTAGTISSAGGDRSRIDQLCQVLGKSPDPAQRKHAAWLLGESGDLPAISFLVGALSDADSAVGREASLALGKIGRPAVDKLIATLNDPRGQVRCNVIMSLGLIGDARAGGPLARLLADADWEVRRDAAKALGAIGDRAAVETLIRAATDRDARVRKEVIWALGKLGDARAPEWFAQL